MRFLQRILSRLLACAANRCHTPKFCKENFHKQPQYLENFLPHSFLLYCKAIAMSRMQTVSKDFHTTWQSHSKVSLKDDA